MIRARFYANADDYRPIKWPPPGPYWCSGYGVKHDSTDGLVTSCSIVIAYARDLEEILEFWPEATHIEAEPREAYTFTDRFPKPKWFSELSSQASADARTEGTCKVSSSDL